jgi:hypothetical protein
MTSFINWNAPIKEGRKNDKCPKCFSGGMKRKGKNRRLCIECDSLFINPKSIKDDT